MAQKMQVILVLLDFLLRNIGNLPINNMAT